MTVPEQDLPGVDRWGEPRDGGRARSGTRWRPLGPILMTVVAIAALLPLLRLAARGWTRSGSEPEYGTISGCVTYNGKPVPGSIVLFHSQTGAIFAVVQCNEDGRYFMSRVRPGDAIITVRVIRRWMVPEEMEMISLDCQSFAAMGGAGVMAVAASPPGLAPFSTLADMLATRDLFMTIPARYSVPEPQGCTTPSGALNKSSISS